MMICCWNTSVINAEFAFDHPTTSQKYPAPPVHSLNDILSSGKFHPAVESVLRRASEVTTRQTDSYRAILQARRDAGTSAGARGDDKQQHHGLCHPTLRHASRR